MNDKITFQLTKQNREENLKLNTLLSVIKFKNPRKELDKKRFNLIRKLEKKTLDIKLG